MAVTWNVVGINLDSGVGSIAVSSNATIPVGSLVYVISVASNSGTGGAACTTTCSDNAAGSTNTWTQRVLTNYDPGAANQGTTLTIFTCILATALGDGDNVTVSYSPNVSQTIIGVFTGVADAGETASYITAGAGATGSSATPTITSGSITSGDTIIGAIAVKPLDGDDTVTGDSDTTSGSWSTKEGDYDLGGSQLWSQRKTVAGTATQTFNPTIVDAQGYAINYIVVRWTAGSGSTSIAAAAGSFAITGTAASLIKAAKSVAAGVGSFSLSGQAATLRKLKDPLYVNSVASTSFDFIRAEDPDSFESVAYLGPVTLGDMPGDNDAAYKYRVTFRDTAHTIDIYLGGTNPVDGSTYASEAAARVDVNKYTPRLGKLPLIYRENISHMIGLAGDAVDDDDENLTSEDLGHFFFIYADRANTRIANHDLEESFFHEGSHASVQRAGAGLSAGLGTQDYLASPEWAAAVAADGAYITTYAASANQEDFAESALFAYTLLLHPDRLAPDEAAIRAQIPNRIAFFQNIVFAGHHTACVRVRASSVVAKLPTRFVQSLVDNTSLLSHCRDIANLKVEAFYSNGNLAAAGKPDIYKFYCTVCGRVHPRYPVGSEPRPFWDVR